MKMANKYDGDDLSELVRYREQIEKSKALKKVDHHEQRLLKLEQQVSDLVTIVSMMVEKQNTNV